MPVDHVGPAEADDAAYPLVATTGRVLQHYQSGAQTRLVPELTAAAGDMFVQVHPETAARAGLDEGDLADVVSRRGRTRAAVRLDEDMRLDVVFLPFHWGGDGTGQLPHPRRPRPDQPHAGVQGVRRPPGGHRMTRSRRHVLIVGNGMAGARLAEEIRQRDPDASRFAVTIVGEEPHAAYNRVLLSTVVSGAITPRDTRLKPDGWWAARHIDVVTGTRVTAVDVDSRTATLVPVAADDERVVRWDELVLATGSTSFVPPSEGLYAGSPGPDPELADGVVAFRTIDDCGRIVAAAESASTAVVLGGGLLGLEAARGLLGKGVDVTIVHPQDFPMDRQLDADGGAVLSRVVRGIGARLVLGRFVVARHAAERRRAGARRARRRERPARPTSSSSPPGCARAPTSPPRWASRSSGPSSSTTAWRPRWRTCTPSASARSTAARSPDSCSPVGTTPGCSPTC